MYRHLILMLSYLFFSSALIAQHHSDSTQSLRSEYAGQESRLIKSLSPDDLQQLRNGEGWGLAKAAELNGYPGPRHVLDLEKEIGLTADQKTRIEALFTSMKAEAGRLGLIFINKEKQLNEAFAGGSVDPKNLKTMLEEISSSRSELRYTHLITHLETASILSQEQIDTYNRLRGYDSISDPCKNIPEGHDPAMWKMHNNCDQ